MSASSHPSIASDTDHGLEAVSVECERDVSGGTVKGVAQRTHSSSVDDGDLCGTPVIVGVAGASGSGKTSIAELIAERLGASVKVLSMSSDNYYISLTPEESAGDHNFDHPASIDFPLLASHLAALKRGKRVEVPHYDFRTHKRTSEVTVITGGEVDVIILDGIFVLWEEAVRAQCDVRIFCSEDLDVCLARRLSRDITARGRTPESVIEQYLRFVKPGYHQFVAPSMINADLIVPRARDNVVAIDMLAREISRRVKDAHAVRDAKR